MNNLYEKPWNSSSENIPDDIYAAKGMLGPEERRCLYWLAKNYYQGLGSIVDAGAFIGSSANALAAGLINSSNYSKFSKSPIIYSYDYFSAIDDYVVEAISRDVAPIKLGDSFLYIFRAQNQKYLPLIKIYEGDFLNHRWDAGSIEILFIDIAKSNELNSHVIKEFFPSLLPGKSIVIQQDYYHVWHTAIHVTMQFLKNYFELIDPFVDHQSRVFRLIKKIPVNELKIAIEYEFSFEDKVNLLRDAVLEAASPNKEMLELAVVLECIYSDRPDDYKIELSRFEINHPDYLNRAELWATQARDVRAYARSKFGRGVEDFEVLNESKVGVEKKERNEIPVNNNFKKLLPESLKRVARKVRNKFSKYPIGIATGTSRQQGGFVGEEQLLNEAATNYPSFHRKEDSSPWFLGLSGDNLKFMASLLRPGMRTIETGAGFSTLAFLIKSCKHIAIFPADPYENEGLEKRIRAYCDEKGISHHEFQVLNAGSQDVVHGLDDEFDFVFIDGEHAFPMPVIDFYYLARRLKVGGVLAVDDCNIWSGEIIAKYLMLDKDWEFIGEKDGKTMYFRLLAPFIDKAFSQQPYLIANSRALPPEFLTAMRGLS